MITIKQMVQREVRCCVSSLVSTLAQGFGSKTPNAELDELIEQAWELAAPIPDYEEAAIQSGWTVEPRDKRVFVNAAANEMAWADPDGACGWEDLCAEFNLEPIECEVFEHWSVSSWLAEKLLEHGEKVDQDFAGMCVWARTTTGQGIGSDGVIERIHATMIAPDLLRASHVETLSADFRGESK